MGETKKSLLQEDDRCLICERQCKIQDGGNGHCRTRVNRNGTIYALNYGNVSSMSINPIEKKPLFHFYPGSRALTVGFWSCNFDCPWCQNFDITKVEPQQKEHLTPQEFTSIALANSCQGISLSFNEPTLFLEWGVEAFRYAKDSNLYKTIVTNGYMTEKALEGLVEAGLDAANVDIKGSNAVVKKYCHADVEKVWRNCRIMREQRIHLEITTLLIRGVNDDLTSLSEIGSRILSELGNIPWHLTRYFPSYKFSNPATSLEFLENACQMAKGLGFKYVYLGNVSGHAFEHTYCPGCGIMLIERGGLSLLANNITDQDKCPKCGYDLHQDIVMC